MSGKETEDFKDSKDMYMCTSILMYMCIWSVSSVSYISQSHTALSSSERNAPTNSNTSNSKGLIIIVGLSFFVYLPN